MAKMIYQYKLADEIKDENMQVAGINLRREWTPFSTIQTNLNPFIKTLSNPNGILDYSKKNMESNEVIFKSIPNIENLPIYSKQDLFIMTRQELCEICKAYTIITQNKRNERLVGEILDAQAKYSTNKQIQDDLIKTEIIVETIIPENNESIDEFLNYKANDNIIDTEIILENKKSDNRLGSILGILNRNK